MAAVRFGGLTIHSNASQRSAYTARELHAEARAVSKGNGKLLHYWLEISANGNPRLIANVLKDGQETQLRVLL